MPIARRRPQPGGNPYAAAPPRHTPLPGPARLELPGPCRVFAYVHKYPPVHNAGAEWMLHSMLRDLVDRGHECRVSADVDAQVVDGVRVFPERFARAGYQWSDVVVTHLDRTALAVRLAHSEKKPLVHLLHNDSQLQFHRVQGSDVSLAVMNSEWLDEAYRSFPARARMVVRPPVLSVDYRVDRSDADRVTLVNMTREKGAQVFYRLAGQLPDVGFLGVRGAYGIQVEPPSPMANVDLLEQTPRIREVYKRTKILLVPSGYESWGRVAVEAMASGIPVIATPTPGLRESLGDAGIFFDIGDSVGWRQAVKDLLTSASTYRHWSDLALRRSAELDVVSRSDLDEWEIMVRRLAVAGRRSSG